MLLVESASSTLSIFTVENPTLVPFSVTGNPCIFLTDECKTDDIFTRIVAILTLLRHSGADFSQTL